VLGCASTPPERGRLCTDRQRPGSLYDPVPDERRPHHIVDEELRLLQRVLDLLRSTEAAAAPSEESVVRELDHLRETLRGAKAEDRAALLQQWDRQSALLRHLRTATRPDPIDAGTPYFAHLRLRENGREHDVLLGKTTRLLPGLPIVDWRNAPISRVFYRYRQGEEFEEEIADRLREGVVAARRTVTVRASALRRVESPEGVFEVADDGGWHRRAQEPPRLVGGQLAALRAYDDADATAHRLGGDAALQRRDRHLPDIASLLDASQFDLVTRPEGFVLIRGVAGSGKTTVALHRIAFLAYDDPAVDSPETMFVVFSESLRRYVSHVLPALGVSKPRVTTFEVWAERHLRHVLPRLPRRRREHVPAVVHALKIHPVTGNALERHMARAAGDRTPEQVIDDWTTVLTDDGLLIETMDEVSPGAFTGDQVRTACDWNRAHQDEVMAWMRGEPGSEGEIDAEDLPVLLRAWQLRIGPLTGPGNTRLRYRHIAIDEVQDFSSLEVRVLLECLDERRSVTLAGDTQQHVVEGGGFASWAGFLRELGLPGAEVHTLDVSYRCSREIAQVALDVLGDLREDDAPPRATRSGPPVELFRFTDHGAAVAFLAETLEALMRREPHASVAVLAPSVGLGDLYHRGLEVSEVPRLRRVSEQDFAFAPGIEVTEVEQAKGLEFDYVVIVEASSTSYPDAPASRRRLHVGMTRAIHQLWLTSVGTPALMLREALRR
jgi:DNA helicase-2/ATP-dependent DNA helicase PcrA